MREKITYKVGDTVILAEIPPSWPDSEKHWLNQKVVIRSICDNMCTVSLAKDFHIGRIYVLIKRLKPLNNQLMLFEI